MAEEDNPGSGATGTGFELERFEFVTGTGTHALARVRGRWAQALDPKDPAPRLVVDLPGRRQHFAALDPREALTFDPATAETWHGAYAVPASLLQRRDVAYAIEGPGGLIGLPPPGEHAPGAGSQPTLDRELERRTAALSERAETAERQLAQLHGAIAELALDLEQAQASVAAADADLADARRQLAEARAEKLANR